jgi:hypothetical protein
MWEEEEEKARAAEWLGGGEIDFRIRGDLADNCFPLGQATVSPSPQSL